MQKIVHVITQSEKRLYEIDCIKWMLCVPRISPDSPRFIHYFSRWLIPDKIAASKHRGDFEEITKNCPLFAPELTRYIQAGMDEYHKFTKTTPELPALKDSPLQIVKVSTKAA